MPDLPADIGRCTFTGRVGIAGSVPTTDPQPDDTPASGRIVLNPDIHQLVHGPSNTVYYLDTIQAWLDENGEFEIVIPATDDPDGQPVDWTYKVSFLLNEGPLKPFHMQAPTGTLQLVSVIPIESSDGEVIALGPPGPSAYAVAVANGFVGTEAEWLASLEGEPGEPGPPGTTAWAGITDKPSTFPPATHNHDDRYYTEAETYTRAEIDGEFATKADLTDLEAYTSLTALADEAATREAADDAEEAARIAADAALLTTIGNETTARTNADNALDARIDTLEAATGPDLSGYATDAELTAEATARANADTALDGRLDTLESTGFATDAELAAHAADTTGIHGIADTSDIVLDGDSRLTDARTPTAHTHDVGDIDATGVPSATTYLRGDGSWATPAGGGDEPRVPVLFSDGRTTLTTGTGTMKFPNITGRTLTIIGVRADVGTAPTGAALIVDVNKNGTTTIFTTQSNRPQIAAGTTTANAAAVNVTSLANGDYLTVDIDQVGSTVAGAYLTVTVILEG